MRFPEIVTGLGLQGTVGQVPKSVAKEQRWMMVGRSTKGGTVGQWDGRVLPWVLDSTWRLYTWERWALAQTWPPSYEPAVQNRRLRIWWEV